MGNGTCKQESTCQTCSSTTSCSQQQKEEHTNAQIEKRMKDVRYKFLIISGKGGVGKSSVSINLGATLAEQGYEVGILDADIHGPNVPKMLGVDTVKPQASEGNILPIAVSEKLRVMFPLIGVVENMSGLTCPHCNNEIELFKTGGGERIAREMDLHFLGRIPLDPEMVISADNGSPLISHAPESPCADAFNGVADRWKALLDGNQSV